MTAYEIHIWVVDTQTNKKERPNKYNTYWDDGRLGGIQPWLKIEYEIKLYPDEEGDTQ